MSSQRRYEGPDLERLLEQVHEELGRGARILSAEKVRSGGVGGFFQRETFEVVVEAPEHPPTPGAPMSSPPLEVALPRDPISTEGASFEAALRRVADGLDDEVAFSPRLSGEAAYRELADDYADGEVDDRMDHVTKVEDDRADGDVDEEPYEPAYEMEADAASAASLAPLAPAIPVRAAPARRGAHARDDASDFDSDDDLGRLPLVKTRPSPRTLRTPTPARSLVAEIDESALGRLGLPAGLVPRGETSRRDLRRALAEQLRALPTAPAVPRDPGAVIVVVGEATGALAMARTVADELKLEPDSVLLASANHTSACLPSWLHLSEPDLVARRRRTWWRRPRPTVVAVEAPLGVEIDAWVPAVLDALEPNMVLALVDARRKPEDIEAWSRTIGGVDAIALENVRATMSPASVLRLPIPVARLDGRPATADRWAGLLVRQLAAA